MQDVHTRERQLEQELTGRIEERVPGTEVLAVELLGPDRFCVYIDHPGGVDHALCERVTRELDDYRREYTIDVSSPGLERPLRKPAHFERAVGRRVAVRTSGEIAGRKRFRGEVLAAEEGEFRVYSIELPPDVEARLLDEARERKLEELEALEAETGERSHTLVSDDDLDVDWSDVPEEQIKRTDVTPANFGRIAAQTAKQVILQRIREAERAMMYDEYVDRVTEVVTGIVQQAGDRNNVLVDLGKVEALLPRSEQVDGERYEQGSRIKAVITEVRSGTKGPQVIVSRRDPELIKTLFELEVPEIADGLVEIRGEKIDIIPWNPEPARFVAKALSPARVREVYLDDDGREATVVTPDDQLALAIGKEGMNARLAARLTGWKIDIKSDTEFA